MTPFDRANTWLDQPTSEHYKLFWSSLLDGDGQQQLPSGFRTEDRMAVLEAWTAYFVEQSRLREVIPSPEPSAVAKAWKILDYDATLGPCWLWQTHTSLPLAALVCLREKGSTEQVVRTVEGHAISVPRFNYWIHPWQEEMPASPELEPALGEWSSRPWRGGLHRAVNARGVAFDVFVMERPGRPWTEWAKNTIVLNDLGGLTPLENEIVRWCRYVVPVSP